METIVIRRKWAASIIGIINRIITDIINIERWFTQEIYLLIQILIGIIRQIR